MKKGFTLLEIIIAMVLISVAIIGIFGNFTSGMRTFSFSVGQAEDISEASSLLQKHLEALENDPAAATTGVVLNNNKDVKITLPATTNIAKKESTITMKQMVATESNTSVLYFVKP